MIIWTGLTAPMAVQQPEGVPQWIGLVFGTTYLLLASMGTFMITKTPNIVGQMRILPAQVSKVAATGPAVTPTPVRMELTIKRMVPMLKPKVIVAPLDEVTLKSRFSLPDEYVPGLKRIELQQKTEEQRKALHKFDMHVSEDLRNTLQIYDWPGNIRELRSTIERAMILSEGEELNKKYIQIENSDEKIKVENTETKMNLEVNLEDASLDKVEQEIIKKFLDLNDWNQTKTAKMLGINRQNLRYRMKKMGLLN